MRISVFITTIIGVASQISWLATARKHQRDSRALFKSQSDTNLNQNVGKQRKGIAEKYQ